MECVPAYSNNVNSSPELGACLFKAGDISLRLTGTIFTLGVCSAAVAPGNALNLM